MQLRQRQQGLGLWGWVFVLSVIGFTAMITLKLIPIYLAEVAIQRVVKSTATDPANSAASSVALRKAMKLRWDVEGITTLTPEDVELVKDQAGRRLQYDYEARAELFYNISLVVHFQEEFPMPGGGGID